MKNATLVIMAAGLGSRFGQGIKQLAPVGPSGEIIIDYSVHDAIEAGFHKIVFIIRKDLERDFREVIGDRIEKKVEGKAEVSYVFQEVDDLPAGFEKPEGRTKPWGTGHAVLSCEGVVDEPFAVINADDYYGKEPYRLLYHYLTQEHKAEEGVSDICMAGFVLKNTLSEHGGVTRGICTRDEKNHLTEIKETSNLIKTAEGAGIKKEDGSVEVVDVNALVSMNMWGFQPEFLSVLKEGFRSFLSAVPTGDVKKEYLLPIFIDQLLKEGKAEVSVLKTNSRWFGVTYQEDQEIVTKEIQKLVSEGVYESNLMEQK